VTVTEPRPFGTPGAIRFARQNLRTDPVMNGDSFADPDLCAFVAHHRRAGAKATLLCAEVDSSAPTEWSRWDVSLELIVAPAGVWPATWLIA
jgi:NDP-sugar pyrophosphorylase family protein